MNRLYIILIVLFAAGSCDKYVDTPLPKNELLSELPFLDDKTANAAVVGVYANMNSFNYYFSNVLINFLTAIQADDMYYFTSSANFDVFRQNNLLPSSQYVETYWSDLYSFVYHANACIKGLTESSTLTPSTKDRLLGEAYFQRAFFYFYLVNLYGDVPLVLSTDYLETQLLGREAAPVVFTQIIADLKEAKRLMTDDYPSGNKVRPNRVAASALLARTYLYTKQYALAEAEAATVISNQTYGLETNLNNVFLANSREAIWQLQPVNIGGGRNTWEGFTGTPVMPNGTAIFRLDTTYLIEKFETGDERLSNWTGFRTTAAGATYYFPYKYKIRTDPSGVVSEYSMVMRMAEQWLIRAEARIQQGKLDLGRQDLDSIRHRAGLLPLPTSLDKDQLLLAVEKERKFELFTEWGHRWFDLKRTNRATAVLGPIKGDNWQPTDTLYPISSEARRTNTRLSQNDGYK